VVPCGSREDTCPRTPQPTGGREHTAFLSWQPTGTKCQAALNSGEALLPIPPRGSCASSWRNGACPQQGGSCLLLGTQPFAGPDKHHPPPHRAHRLTSLRILPCGRCISTFRVPGVDHLGSVLGHQLDQT